MTARRANRDRSSTWRRPERHGEHAPPAAAAPAGHRCPTCSRVAPVNGRGQLRRHLPQTRANADPTTGYCTGSGGLSAGPVTFRDDPNGGRP